MANIKSQIKRILTNKKSQDRNKAVKSEVKTAVRATRSATRVAPRIPSFGCNFFRLGDDLVSLFIQNPRAGCKNVFKIPQSICVP